MIFFLNYLIFLLINYVKINYYNIINYLFKNI